MNLQEWTIGFVKRRAAIVGGECIDTPQGATLVWPDNRQEFVVRQTLSTVDTNLEPKVATIVVCEYSEQNFNFLADQFADAAKHEHLSFLFVHPHGDTWRIKPALHMRLADPATLKQGLRASFDAVLGKGE